MFYTELFHLRRNGKNGNMLPPNPEQKDTQEKLGEQREQRAQRTMQEGWASPSGSAGSQEEG